ncbi:MAG TPA: cation:proton antiporter [Ktedonobacterales bacterium]|nr:cation:proton antiporter [Ktedonobacterales bacterium]
MLSARGEVEILTLLLAVGLATALVARALRFPYTLALALVGLVIGVFVSLPELQLTPDVILFIFLPILLFEGAWNIEVSKLLANWLLIFLLAIPGLLIAVAIAAFGLRFGAGLPWLIALLIAAIISPTDPIAVIALMRQLGMSSRLRTVIEGESLFNDGVGAATFSITLSLLAVTLAPGFTGFTREALVSEALAAVWLFAGGILIGGALGWLISRLLRLIKDRLIETSVTIIAAYGVYVVADLLAASGILAVVIAGLILGSYGRRVGISDASHDAVDNTWEALSYVATSLLFLLLGVQLSHVAPSALPIIAWATAGVIVGRAVIVYGMAGLHNAIARAIARTRRAHTRARGRPTPIPGAWNPILLLSGLRGALSIALALSLPASTPYLGQIQDAVYGVILITLLGQGVALRFLLPRWPGMAAARPSPEIPEKAAENEAMSERES